MTEVVESLDEDIELTRQWVRETEAFVGWLESERSAARITTSAIRLEPVAIPTGTLEALLATG